MSIAFLEGIVINPPSTAQMAEVRKSLFLSTVGHDFIEDPRAIKGRNHICCVLKLQKLPSLLQNLQKSSKTYHESKTKQMQKLELKLSPRSLKQRGFLAFNNIHICFQPLKHEKGARDAKDTVIPKKNCSRISRCTRCGGRHSKNDIHHTSSG